MTQSVLEIQEGLWIQERWIRDAGLGRRLQVIVTPGEIRIVQAENAGERTESTEGWRIFRTLGDDAPSGKLANAAVDHDRYLYDHS